MVNENDESMIDLTIVTPKECSKKAQHNQIHLNHPNNIYYSVTKSRWLTILLG